MDHVGLDFANKKPNDLFKFGDKVHTAQLANVPLYAGCLITAVMLNTANQDYGAKIDARAEGGPISTKVALASRAVLLGLLYQIAAWLEGKAAGNADTINLAGFDTVEHVYSPQTILLTPAIKAILNFMTTQLKLRVTTVPNANSFEAQYRIAGGAWVPCGSFPNSRAIIITGLVPGVMYEFRVRAVGGLTGWSAWSDTASHMCM